jgi:hypothetical protein
LNQRLTLRRALLIASVVIVASAAATRGAMYLYRELSLTNIGPFAPTPRVDFCEPAVVRLQGGYQVTFNLSSDDTVPTEILAVGINETILTGFWPWAEVNGTYFTPINVPPGGQALLVVWFPDVEGKAAFSSGENVVLELMISGRGGTFWVADAMPTSIP